jgi:peroxiredoxin
MHPAITHGGTFPDFTTLDHTGTPQTLSQLAGRDPLALIIYRGWW